jgi:hypothetical protein
MWFAVTILIVVAAMPTTTTETPTACADEFDCYLNGFCSANATGAYCLCDSGWTGSHCGQFDFMPTPPGPLGGKAFPPESDSSTWGSSVVKGDDGKYHMFTSGILGKCGLAVWAANAALTHAISDTLDGVYTAHDVIMKGSNPQITRFNGELRLWHSLGGGPVEEPGDKGYCATCTNGTTPYTCRNESSARKTELVSSLSPSSSKLIVATKMAGPWKNVAISCTGWNEGSASGGGGGDHGHEKGTCPPTSNPTAYYFPNGTTLLAYDWQMKGQTSVGFFLARAPSVAGPYTPVSGHWNVTTITWEKVRFAHILSYFVFCMIKPAAFSQAFCIDVVS